MTIPAAAEIVTAAKEVLAGARGRGDEMMPGFLLTDRDGIDAVVLIGGDPSPGTSLPRIAATFRLRADPDNPLTPAYVRAAWVSDAFVEIRNVNSPLPGPEPGEYRRRFAQGDEAISEALIVTWWHEGAAWCVQVPYTMVGNTVVWRDALDPTPMHDGNVPDALRILTTDSLDELAGVLGYERRPS